MKNKGYRKVEDRGGRQGKGEEEECRGKEEREEWRKTGKERKTRRRREKERRDEERRGEERREGKRREGKKRIPQNLVFL